MQQTNLTTCQSALYCTLRPDIVLQHVSTM